MSKQKKESKKEAAIKLLKKILIGGGICLAWTFTMLLVIVIVDDINAGVLIFMTINGWLYKLYATLVGIGILLFLLKHIFVKKNKSVPEIVAEDPREYKKKHQD